MDDEHGVYIKVIEAAEVLMVAVNGGNTQWKVSPVEFEKMKKQLFLARSGRRSQELS